MELMVPGGRVRAWATKRLRRSKTPAERSPASRTMEVKEVRMSAAACSLTTPTSRLQQMSSVTGSSALRLKHSPAAQKGPEARRRPAAAREAYSLYVERAAEGANEADGPFSAVCLEAGFVFGGARPRGGRHPRGGGGAPRGVGGEREGRGMGAVAGC